MSFKQATMSKEQGSKAHEALRKIASKSDTSVRAIYQLVTQAFADDEKYQKTVNAVRNQEIQYKQLELLRIQTTNELIQNQLLSFTLKRKLKIRKFFGLIKKSKEHEHGKRD